jgi:hypothetical protein
MRDRVHLGMEVVEVQDVLLVQTERILVHHNIRKFYHLSNSYVRRQRPDKAVYQSSPDRF